MHRPIERALAACVSVACCSMTSCERRSADEAWVIPGPTVPSVTLQAPFVWDTRDELTAWTANIVSRGTFRLDEEDSNGAIAIQFFPDRFDLLLRGPDLDPPLRRVRAVRIRYRWGPSDAREPATLVVRFNALNSPRPELQLRGSAALRATSTWTEAELRVPSYAFTFTPLDVTYVYFEGGGNDGVLKIDSIALVTEP